MPTCLDVEACVGHHEPDGFHALQVLARTSCFYPQNTTRHHYGRGFWTKKNSLWSGCSLPLTVSIGNELVENVAHLFTVFMKVRECQPWMSLNESSAVLVSRSECRGVVTTDVNKEFAPQCVLGYGRVSSSHRLPPGSIFHAPFTKYLLCSRHVRC